MTVGIISLMFMLMMTGSLASSGSDTRSNFSRSLVAAISRSVSSTYVIWIMATLSEDLDVISSTPETCMTADSNGLVTSSSMSLGVAPAYTHMTKAMGISISGIRAICS